MPGSAASVVFSPLWIWSFAATVSVALLVRLVVAWATGMPTKPRAYDCASEEPSMIVGLFGPRRGVVTGGQVDVLRGSQLRVRPESDGLV